MRIPKKEEKKFNYSRNAVANNSAVRPPTKYDVIHRRQEIESAIHWAFSLFFNFKILTSSWMWSSLISFFLLGNILSSCTSAVLERGYVIHCSPSFFSIVSETREIINFPSFSPFELWLVFNRGEWYLYISPVVFIPCGGIESVFISSLF